MPGGKLIRKSILVIAALGVAAPAVAFDYEELMKLKRQFEVVRDLIRKLRGREPAPPPPSPPTQTPAPGGQPGPSTDGRPVVVPAPATGMNFAGSCVGRDETGYAENAQVRVADGKVSQMNVRIDVPSRGNCRYQLAVFRQTKQTPFVELIANNDATCAVRMWQQGDRITLTASECASQCTGSAFEYAWPVEFNAKGGCG
ncbi:MAG: hypothetical protein JNM79_14340 [Burkholderiales bacterium]|nr:hypothetical protein [Burkholderiales bacterium]